MWFSATLCQKISWYSFSLYCRSNIGKVPTFNAWNLRAEMAAMMDTNGWSSSSSNSNNNNNNNGWNNQLSNQLEQVWDLRPTAQNSNSSHNSTTNQAIADVWGNLNNQTTTNNSSRGWGSWSQKWNKSNDLPVLNPVVGGSRIPIVKKIFRVLILGSSSTQGCDRNPLCNQTKSRTCHTNLFKV